MRTIKFRLWDGEMRDIRYMSMNPKGSFFCVCSNQDEYDGITEIMQFTGMQDMNGKDIYDGDIVENYVGEKFLVEFDSYGFRTRGLGKSPVSYPLSTWKQLEIIGNIHDNPELLEAL